MGDQVGPAPDLIGKASPERVLEAVHCLQLGPGDTPGYLLALKKQVSGAAGKTVDRSDPSAVFEAIRGRVAPDVALAVEDLLKN